MVEARRSQPRELAQEHPDRRGDATDFARALNDAGGSSCSSSCVSWDGLALVIAPTRGPKPRLGQLGWYRGVSAQQQIPSLDGRDFLIG